MYKLEDIRDVHLEITSKCQAKCPMCPRRINGGPMNPFVSLDEITLDIFKKWFPEDFIKQLNSMFMCGNLGDPIISKDTLEIYQYLRQTSPRIRLSMHTNGSARDENWWKKLAQQRVIVTFGLDGLKDTNHLYRRNVKWEKVMQNSKAFLSTGARAHWDMLIFDHNKHQVDQAKQTAKQMGFILKTKYDMTSCSYEYNYLYVLKKPNY